MTTPPAPGASELQEPSDALLATQLRTLFHLHRAWGHDLRAPLNNLTLIAELMRADVDSDADPAQLAAHLKSFRESIERMTRLVERFLILNAPATTAVERIDLRAHLRELESLLAPEARRRRITITVHLPAEEVPLQAVRDRLRQGCLAAMILALESIPAGSGDLEVSLASEPAAIRIGVRSRQHDSPSSVASIAPQPTERPSGITLEMARALIATASGQLSEESSPGAGLALAILLPRA